MPRNIARVAPVLGEYRCTEQDDVRPDQVFDRVQDVRVARDVHQPRKRQIALDLQGLVGVMAGSGLIGLDPALVVRRLLRRKRAAWIDIAVLPEMIDLFLRQKLAHRRLRETYLPIGFNAACCIVAGNNITGLPPWIWMIGRFRFSFMPSSRNLIGP